MTQKTKKPEIRFADFTGEWDEQKFSIVAIMHARIGWQNLRKSEFLDRGDYYLITGTDFVDGEVDLSNCHYITKDRYEQDPNIQVSNESILITKDGTLGKVAFVSGLDKPATLNAGVFNIIIRDNKKVYSKYLFQYLKAPFLMDYVNQKATGGTIKHLNQNILIDFPIELPEYDEQKKIGDFLTALDRLINLQQRKVEKYLNVKKSMLEKMFPKAGNRVPEIRFAGFTGDWEQKELGKIVDITMGQSPDGATYSDTPSDYILIQGNADIQNGWVVPRVWTTQITKKADAGDLIMSVRAPAGAMGKTAYDAVIGRGVAAIKGNEFIFQTLIKMDIDGYWKKYSEGSTFESLNSNSIKNAIISIPSQSEQDCIGCYLTTLDTLVSLQQRKLEKLQNVKKAMLEKMFV